MVKEKAKVCEIPALAPHDLRRTCARLCHQAGGELEQILFLLGRVSVQATERYLGCEQRFHNAVNDRIGIEPDPPGWSSNSPHSPTLRYRHPMKETLSMSPEAAARDGRRHSFHTGAIVSSIAPRWGHAHDESKDVSYGRSCCFDSSLWHAISIR